MLFLSNDRFLRCLEQLKKYIRHTQEHITSKLSIIITKRRKEKENRAQRPRKAYNVVELDTEPEAKVFELFLSCNIQQKNTKPTNVNTVSSFEKEKKDNEQKRQRWGLESSL